MPAMLDHAIVMGGSVAGLCAAAALAEVAKSVTLLERDARPEGTSARKGTPQCHHAHVLLNLGQRSLESLAPGLLDELERRGAVVGDVGENFRWFVYGAWKPIFTKGLAVHIQSRPMLEASLRDIIARHERIELRFATPIDEPIFDQSSGRVRGVRLEDGSELPADMVVDATGRGSKTPKWLEQWGYQRPAQQSVEVGLAYVSGLFEIPAGASPPADALLIYPNAPELKRGGAAFHVEGDRWLVTLFGYHGDHAPTDLDGFRAWAGTLAEPEIQRAIVAGTLTGELRKFTYPKQVRNLYERLSRMPEGYIVIGDAVCSFDPVFGQGMSVAAAEGVVLRELLRRGKLQPKAIHKALAKVVDDPWQLATTEAYRWAETTGYKPAGVGFLHRFTQRVHEVAAGDTDVYSAFLDVVQLDKRPTSLFALKVLRKLLRGPIKATQ